MRFLAYRPATGDRTTASAYELATASAAAEQHAEQTYDAVDDEAGPIAVNVVAVCDDGAELELEFNVLIDFEPRFAAERRTRS